MSCDNILIFHRYIKFSYRIVSNTKSFLPMLMCIQISRVWHIKCCLFVYALFFFLAFFFQFWSKHMKPLWYNLFFLDYACFMWRYIWNDAKPKPIDGCQVTNGVDQLCTWFLFGISLCESNSPCTIFHSFVFWQVCGWEVISEGGRQLHRSGDGSWQWKMRYLLPFTMFSFRCIENLMQSGCSFTICRMIFEIGTVHNVPWHHRCI